MLVLRRKAGEAIVLNGTITIHVLAVEGERVKLGISAPPEVVIVRSELLENQGQASGQEQAGPTHGSAREPSHAFRKPENASDEVPAEEEPLRGGRNVPHAPSRYGQRSRAGSETPAVTGQPVRYR